MSTRRQFLGTGLALGAGALASSLPTPARSAPSRQGVPPVAVSSANGLRAVETAVQAVC